MLFTGPASSTIHYDCVDCMAYHYNQAIVQMSWHKAPHAIVYQPVLGMGTYPIRCDIYASRAMLCTVM